MTDTTADLVAALEEARVYMAAFVARDERRSRSNTPHPLTPAIRQIDAALARAKGTWPAEREVGQAVYERIEKLIDAKPDTPEAVELAYLSHLVESVEEVGGYDGPEQPLARAKGAGEVSDERIAAAMHKMAERHAEIEQCRDAIRAARARLEDTHE